MTLVAKPMDLAKPLTQCLLLSLISPPLPALPGFPPEAPSVLSLNHSSGGLGFYATLDDMCNATWNKK